MHVLQLSKPVAFNTCVGGGGGGAWFLLRADRPPQTQTTLLQRDNSSTTPSYLYDCIGLHVAVC